MTFHQSVFRAKRIYLTQTGLIMRSMRPVRKSRMYGMRWPACPNNLPACLPTLSCSVRCSCRAIIHKRLHSENDRSHGEFTSHCRTNAFFPVRFTTRIDDEKKAAESPMPVRLFETREPRCNTRRNVRKYTGAAARYRSRAHHDATPSVHPFVCRRSRALLDASENKFGDTSTLRLVDCQISWQHWQQNIFPAF